MTADSTRRFEVCDQGAFADDVEAYYQRLSERLTAVPEEERPEDRMFL